MAQTKVTAPGIADDAVTVGKIPILPLLMQNWLIVPSRLME